MRNTYKLIFSEDSIVGLNEIINYLEFKFSYIEINAFATKFDELILLIQINPETFPVVYSNNIRRAILKKRTSIFYLIESNEIHILSIFDNRKNPKTLKNILKF